MHACERANLSKIITQSVEAETQCPATDELIISSALQVKGIRNFEPIPTWQSWESHHEKSTWESPWVSAKIA